MDEQLIKAICNHIQRHVGRVGDVLHELIPDDPHVDIHIVPPSEKRPFYTLVTSGMSEHPMSLPEELEGQLTPYAELMLCVPAAWKLHELEDPRWNWPVFWLRFLAKYSHKSDTWLYVSHTIPNTEDCEPFAPDTRLCCWFVREPHAVREAFHEMRYKDRTIAFLALTAIYRSEMEFALSREMDSRYGLDQALAEAGVTELLDPTRPELKLSQLKRHLGKLPS